jgi:GxxExxY protein
MQVRLAVYYKEILLSKEFITDYVAYDKIMAEFKCLSQLTGIEDAQVLNYLKATGIKLGLLINFGGRGKLEWKRLIRTGEFLPILS